MKFALIPLGMADEMYFPSRVERSVYTGGLRPSQLGCETFQSSYDINPKQRLAYETDRSGTNNRAFVLAYRRCSRHSCDTHMNLLRN